MMKSMILTLTLLAGLLTGSMSMATNSPKTPTSTGHSTSQSTALSSARSKSSSHASAKATGGSASATGGAGGGGGSANATGEGGAGGIASSTQTQTASGGNQSQSADNTGNAQSINYEAVRNAPSLSQGSLMPSGCGAAGNGGGSGPNGAGFLGVAFTTSQCYALMAAAAYSAIGMPDTSCDLLNSMKSVKESFKRLGKSLPDCTMAKNHPEASPAVVVLDRETVRAGTPTKQEMNESIDRALRKTLEK